MKIYGQTKPPDYNLSRIDSKYIVLMSGVNDILSDPTDVNQLRNHLTGFYLNFLFLTYIILKTLISSSFI